MTSIAPQIPKSTSSTPADQQEPFRFFCQFLCLICKTKIRYDHGFITIIV